MHDYTHDALQPYIWGQTLDLHHSKHLQAYVNSLNAAEQSCAQAPSPKEQIELQSTLKFNRGGHVNHWRISRRSPRVVSSSLRTLSRRPHRRLCQHRWAPADAGSATNPTPRWRVECVICASFAKPASSTLVLVSPNRESSGLPTLAPTPATTPAAPRANTILPDPVPLFSHSMTTLCSLGASNATIVTVADKLRRCVRTLALRLAGVPAVTPLVHAFPSVTDWYVYTPFDGDGMRASLPMPSHATLRHPPLPQDTTRTAAVVCARRC
ncbi:hypothetical protein L227DRAFT_651179 [Lentinus tigrinus ALCF2SS1-6]|uniref:superoxide dismutase n=1 Tax=Lentinus tigrinus ALCF2SS1-6 TaxID=1328759 RepID=A0A5C2SKC8_9APHY|nr:hypothetical protein L227DRAFT_651179 [Lentinus tigrinus ALCF2SS1-6]